ncbi:hypothetical protein H8959_003819 [Pygathrix nigripes]
MKNSFRRRRDAPRERSSGARRSLTLGPQKSVPNLKVDNVIQAQTAFSANPANPAILSEAAAPISQDGNLYPKLYPELSQYMGLS